MLKKIKLTPLRIVAMVCIGIGIWALLSTSSESRQRSGVGMSWIMPLLLLLLAFMVFFADWLFRKFIPEPQKVWVVECMVILIITVFVVLQQL